MAEMQVIMVSEEGAKNLGTVTLGDPIIERERVEYLALTGIEQVVYDLLGQRGCSHVGCMEGVHEYREGAATVGPVS